MESIQNHSFKSYDENLKVNNIMAAIILCFSLINGAVGIEGVSYVTIACVFLLFVYGIIRRTVKIYVESLLIPIYVTAVFFISFFRVYNTEYTMYYFKYFLGFCLLSFLIGMQKVSICDVLKNVERIGFVCIIIFTMRGFDGYDASIQMGIMYSMLPVLYAAIINIIEKQYKIILSFFNIVVILWCYINVAPRGVWLNMAITAVIYVFLRFGRKESASFRFVFRIVGIITIVLGVWVLYQYLGTILIWISNTIYKLTNRELYALGKAVFLFNSGNLSNGRSELIDLAKVLLKGKLFLGRGIGYFEIIQGSGGYVHNVVYQLFCEAGVFFFIPFIIISFSCIKYMLKIKIDQDSINFSFFLLLFSNGFITLFYSSVHWKLLCFWFLLGYVIELKKMHYNLFD